MSKIKIIENIDKEKFEDEVNELLQKGYSISSTSCSFAGNKYQAILITHVI